MAEEPEHYYNSNLIVTSQTVSWTLHNMSELQKQGAWTAYSCDIELPLGTHRISRWNISLMERDGIIFVRPRIVTPPNETISYRISVRIGDQARYFPMGETHNKIKDLPKFELGDTQRIIAETDDDKLELGLTIKLFSQDSWETK